MNKFLSNLLLLAGIGFLLLSTHSPVKSLSSGEVLAGFNNFSKKFPRSNQPSYDAWVIKVNNQDYIPKKEKRAFPKFNKLEDTHFENVSWKGNGTVNFTKAQFMPFIKQIDQKLLLQLVNAIRNKGCYCGNEYFQPVSPVSWNEKLEISAMAHSVDMAQNNFFDHTSSRCHNPGDRINSSGYNWSSYGENIALGYQDERAVIYGWLKSPGHCRNIMNKDIDEMGVARSKDYWTQVFGRKMFI